MNGTPPRPFVCPLCGRVSHHPRDAEERFCVRCGFVDDRALALTLAPPPRELGARMRLADRMMLSMLAERYDDESITRALADIRASQSARSDA